MEIMSHVPCIPHTLFKTTTFHSKIRRPEGERKKNGTQFIKLRWAEWEEEGVYLKLIEKGRRKETELNWNTQENDLRGCLYAFSHFGHEGFFFPFIIIIF